MIRSTTGLLAVFLVAGCAASRPAASPAPAAAHAHADLEPTEAFRACFREAHQPWLVALIVEMDQVKARQEEVVTSMVGPSKAEQDRARAHLRDLSAGKYESAERMGGSVFARCMTAAGEQAAAVEASMCFQEQRLIMSLMVLRFDQGLSREQAEAELIATNHSDDGRKEAVIRRLAGDVYERMERGRGSVLIEAEYLVCTRRYYPPKT